MPQDNLNVKICGSCSDIPQRNIIEDLIRSLNRAYGDNPRMVLEVLIRSMDKKGVFKIQDVKTGCLGSVECAWEAIGDHLDFKESKLRHVEENLRSFVDEVLINTASHLSQPPYMSEPHPNGTSRFVYLHGQVQWHVMKVGDTITIGCWILAMNHSRRNG